MVCGQTMVDDYKSDITGIGNRSLTSLDFARIFTVYMLYGQLADKPTRRQPTRRQTNSPTNQLADTQTRRQSNSPTNQLADNKLADRPSRRQLNWPKKQLAEIEIVTKIDVRFFGHMDVSFW